MNKKAQAATEFLFTYGWALLVVLIAVGLLIKVGFSMPEKQLPERCSAPAGFDCVDKPSVVKGAEGEGYFEIAFVANRGTKVTILNGDAPGTNDDPTTTDDCTIPQDSTAGPSFQIGLEQPDGTVSAPIDITDSIEIENTMKARIRVYCSNAITKDRFKTELTIKYTDSNTGLAHNVPFSIRGHAK